MKLLRSWDAGAILFLAVFPWLVFWQAAVGISVFAAGDLSSFFYPVRLQLARALAEGRLPLWEPGLGGGFPLFAEGQIAALYPPNLILFRLLPTPLALSWSILLHLSWAAIGIFAFARVSGLRVSSAMLAGFVFSFSGFFLAHIPHVSLIATASWLGWLLYLQKRMAAARRIKSRARKGWFALTGLALGLQFLSGFPQIALLNVLAVLTFSVLDTIENRARGRAWETMLLAIGAVGLGLLVGSVQLLPTAELAALSTRGGVGQEFFTSYSLELSNVAQFFSPFTTVGEPFTETQEFWGFFGVSTLLLALTAVVLKRSARTRFLGASALVTLALSLGGNNPIYSLLYAIPIFNRFRVPARFLFLFMFSMVYLAAIGFDGLQSRLRESERGNRIARWLPFPIGFAVASFFVARNALGGQLVLFAWNFLPWIFLVAVLVLIALSFTRKLSNRVFSMAVLGAVILELSLFSLPFLSGLALTVPTAAFVAPPPAILAMDNALPLARVWTNNYSPDLRPNRPMAYGKQGAQIYSPLALEGHAEYLNAMSSAMLNLMGIRYVLEPSTSIPATAVVPTSTLPVDVLRKKIYIPATRVKRLDIVSFTNGTASLGDGTPVGEVVASSGSDSKSLTLKLGSDTAEWNYELIRESVKHSQPTTFRKFATSLRQSGTSGEKYVARYDLTSPMIVEQIAVTSILSSAALTVDQVILYDDAGKAASVLALAGLPDYTLAEIDDQGVMYENPGALPRAFIVHQVEIADDAQSLEGMNAAGFQPERVALLAAGPALNHSSEFDASQVADRVSVAEYRPEHVAIHTQSAVDGYLILTDIWYPGWTASVDGARAEIMRADLIFRAAKLNAGAHSVVFEYQPASLMWGAGFSSLGMITVLGFAVAGIRK